VCMVRLVLIARHGTGAFRTFEAANENVLLSSTTPSFAPVMSRGPSISVFSKDSVDLFSPLSPPMCSRAGDPREPSPFDGHRSVTFCQGSILSRANDVLPRAPPDLSY